MDLLSVSPSPSEYMLNRPGLSYTRQSPPTLPELESDFTRQSDLLPMIAQIAERERLERIRQGYLVEGGSISGPQVAGRIQEPSFYPPQSGSSSTPTLQPKPLLRSKPETPTRTSAEDTESRGWSSAERTEAQGRTSTEGSDNTYPVPAPTRPHIAPPARTSDPGKHNSRDELRRLSEEDTRRRMAESGLEAEPGKAEKLGGERKTGVEGVGLGGGGLAPRRRGGR